MKENWMDNVKAVFVTIYGQKEGARLFSVVMPGILADFRKQLDGAFPGLTVTEDYHIEHTRSVILVKGRKQVNDGQTELLITEITIDGRPIDL